MTDPITWTNERRKIRDLIPWPRNPRQIKGEQVRRLQESVEEFGQFETVAVGPGNEVYNGHQRLKSWGAKYGPDYEVEVRVSSRELTEKEREKLTILAHKGAAGEWDFDTLANEFELPELLEWGFSEKELLGVFPDEPKGDDPGAQIDKAEELREKWGVETGQLWSLGEHRLICGDCTDRAVVERVMGNDKCTLLFTDPPYGVSIGAKQRLLNSFQPFGRNLTDVENDSLNVDELRSMLLNTFMLARQFLADDCSVFVCAPQIGNLGLMMMMMMMMDAGLEIRHVLNWVKNAPTFSLGRLDYEYKHEPILFTWTKTHKRKKDGEFHTSVWEVDKPRHSAEHPTMKPVALYENAILNHTDSDDVMYEPFCGSGTAIIAAERRKRKCRAVEISPAYVAVAIQRWVDMTGGTPELISQVTP